LHALVHAEQVFDGTRYMRRFSGLIPPFCAFSEDQKDERPFQLFPTNQLFHGIIGIKICVKLFH